MEEALHPPLVLACFVSFAGKKFLNTGMDVRGFFPVAHTIKTDFLAALHCVIEPPHRFAGATFDDGARDIAEVTRFLRARENINDDWLARAQYTMPALVRITGLLTAGH